MGYVETIVQSGISYAEDAGVAQYVEKARSLKAIDQAYDLVLQRGPQLIETLDRKVDLTLEKKNEIVEIADKKKTLVLETVDKKKAELVELADKKKAELTETVDKTRALVHEKKALVLDSVQEKKALVLDTVDKTKATVLETKDSTEAAVRSKVAEQKTKALAQLEVAQAKKDEYVQLAYAKADDAAQAKADLVRKLLAATAGTAAEPAAKLLVLYADIAIVKGESVVRKGLQLPMTLKERMAQRPSVQEAREFVFDFAQTTIYRPLSVQYVTVAVFVLDGKQQLTAAAASRFADAQAQLTLSARTAKDRCLQLAQDPRFAQFNVYVAHLKTQGADAKTQLVLLSQQAAQKLAVPEAYIVVLKEQKAVVIVYAQQAQAKAQETAEQVSAVYAKAAETAKAKVAELKTSYKSHTA